MPTALGVDHHHHFFIPAICTCTCKCNKLIRLKSVDFFTTLIHSRTKSSLDINCNLTPAPRVSKNKEMSLTMILHWHCLALHFMKIQTSSNLHRKKMTNFSILHYEHLHNASCPPVPHFFG